MEEDIIKLNKLDEHIICSIGEKIMKYYSEDLRYIRTTVCENSYIEVKTEKGHDIIEKLKKEYSF